VSHSQSDRHRESHSDIVWEARNVVEAAVVKDKALLKASSRLQTLVKIDEAILHCNIALYQQS
jgi:hypothetical protein